MQLQLAEPSEIDTTTTAKTAPVRVAKGPYQRDESWLERATDEILDPKHVPVGSLNADDVESIVGLMTAWGRRKSVAAALTVESLLKRVIDDMKAGNRKVKTTTRLYTIVSFSYKIAGLWKDRALF
jgi:hypothetical protein